MSVRGICFQAGVLDDLTHFELEQTAAVAIYHTHLRLEQIYIQCVLFSNTALYHEHILDLNRITKKYKRHLAAL